jgi:hypothetical protein
MEILDDEPTKRMCEACDTNELTLDTVRAHEGLLVCLDCKKEFNKPEVPKNWGDQKIQPYQREILEQIGYPIPEGANVDDLIRDWWVEFQQAVRDVPPEATQIGEGVWISTGTGANAQVSAGDRLFMEADGTVTTNPATSGTSTVSAGYRRHENGSVQFTHVGLSPSLLPNPNREQEEQFRADVRERGAEAARELAFNPLNPRRRPEAASDRSSGLTGASINDINYNFPNKTVTAYRPDMEMAEIYQSIQEFRSGIIRRIANHRYQMLNGWTLIMEDGTRYSHEIPNDTTEEVQQAARQHAIQEMIRHLRGAGHDVVTEHNLDGSMTKSIYIVRFATRLLYDRILFTDDRIEFLQGNMVIRSDLW